MIKIECPSCAASYELDGKRVPPVGLNMRCPQCTTVFRVHADGSVVSEGAPPPPPNNPPPLPSKTQTGVGPISEPPLPSAHARAGHDEIPEPISLPPLDDGLDLPMPKDDVDLPAPRSAGANDLGLDLPAAKGDVLDLPQLRGDEIDLPMARSDADLPAPLGEKVDLPVPKADLDLPSPKGSVNPASADDLFPSAGAVPRTPPPPSVDVHTGELPPIAGDDVADDLLMPASADLGLELELDDFRQAGAGAAPSGAPEPDLSDLLPDIEPGLLADIEPDFIPHGEADVPLRGGPAAIDLPADDLEGLPLGDEPDDLEFADFPEAGAAGAGASIVDALAGPKEKKGRKRLRVPYWLERALPVLVVLGILAAGGYSLKETKYGAFGRYWFERFLPSSGDAEHVEQVITQAEELAESDTYGGVREGVGLLERLLRTSGLNRRLLARSLLHESLYQIRFGEDAESARRADEILATLQSRGSEAPDVEVAFAADLLRRGQIAPAMAAVQRARVQSPSDPYVELVAGEVALANADASTAIASFQAAVKKNGGARAQWGLARAYLANHDYEKAASAQEETVTLSQNHIAARTAVAQRWLGEDKIEAARMLLLEPAGVNLVDGVELPASAKERSEALRVLGDVEQRRGRRGAAREAYMKASQLNAQNLEANYGLATMLLADANYKDAFTRFQSLMSAGIEEQDPSPEAADGDEATRKQTKPDRPLSLRAKLGAAEALNAMALSQQAETMLRGVEKKYPNDALVAFWVAETAAARKRDDKALKYYEKAIELDPTAFRPYVGLSRHLSNTGNPREALSVLAKASKYVPMTAEVRRLRGEAQLAQGEVTEAISEFEAALRMEPENLAVRFQLARGLRLAPRLTDATQVLNSIERVDPTYPGIAIEKGLIAEANKDLDAAVSHYRAALEANPNDFAVKVRLASALLETKDLDQAQVILEDLVQEKAYSHEVLYLLGRLEFSQGRYSRARQNFEKAVRLDRNNAVYRMYGGWIAFETNDLSNALRQLEEALEFDPKLGDAYWLRARVHMRTGAVEDALKDLTRALKYNPDRVEAFAEKAESQVQLGRTADAAESYKEALSRDPSQGRWWYRLGRIQLDLGKANDGYDALDRAMKLADTMTEPPHWLADTHLLMGEHAQKAGNKAEAIAHYRRYLELAHEDAIDRPEVEVRLERLGAPVTPEADEF